MKFRTAKMVAAAGALITTGFLATGCGSAQAARLRMIRANLTPEMKTLHQRPADYKNDFALMANENWRMFHGDWARVTYTDRPSRLTREPIPR